jgi:hypothetical protein
VLLCNPEMNLVLGPFDLSPRFEGPESIVKWLVTGRALVIGAIIFADQPVLELLR